MLTLTHRRALTLFPVADGAGLVAAAGEVEFAIGRLQPALRYCRCHHHQAAWRDAAAAADTYLDRLATFAFAKLVAADDATASTTGPSVTKNHDEPAPNEETDRNLDLQRVAAARMRGAGQLAARLAAQQREVDLQQLQASI